MTNEEIIQSVRSKYVTEGQVTMYTVEQIGLMLNMLREKMQGVEVWVSWDEDYFGEHPNPKISDDEPVEWVAGQFDVAGCDMRTEIFESFATMLGVEQGQCRKFRIVEVLP